MTNSQLFAFAGGAGPLALAPENGTNQCLAVSGDVLDIATCQTGAAAQVIIPGLLVLVWRSLLRCDDTDFHHWLLMVVIPRGSRVLGRIRDPLSIIPTHIDVHLWLSFCAILTYFVGKLPHR